jgi:hypothetical protein
MSLVHNAGASLRYRNLLVVIKQTAYEEYSQVRRIPSVCLEGRRRFRPPSESSFPLNIPCITLYSHVTYHDSLQLKLRGQAPKALRWKRLESRYKAHKQCVNDLLGILRHHQVNFSCVNRVELDRQHLADVDLVVAVGGDGTVLSSAHFLDHGTIPLFGINSDPTISTEEKTVKNKKSDERRYVLL